MNPAPTGKLEWQKAPVRLDLGENDVHLWRASLDVPQDLRERLAHALAPEELRKAERYASPAARDQYLVTRGILRDVIARYLTVAPAELCFRRAERGKPEVAEPADTRIEFNLSDSGAWVVYAVTRGRRVGVDVERIDSRRPLRRLAGRFLAPGEIAALQATPDSKLADVFYGIWTRKEAYLKATGEGLLFPLSRFDVTAPETLGQWRLSGVPVDEGYRAAVAVEGDGWQLRAWEWRPAY